MSLVVECKHKDEMGMWCLGCLNYNLSVERSKLDPCHCSQIKGEHRHDPPEG